MFVVALLGAGAIVGAFATKATSHGSRDGYRDRGHHGSWYGKRHRKGHKRHHGFRKLMHMMHSDKDAAEIEKRATRMVKHMAVEIDATNEQTDKIVDIVSSLVREVAPMREEFRTTRKAVVDMLKTDSPDRDALEKLRSEQVSRWDTVSKRVIGAIADASAVLTDEQRAQVRKRFERRHKHKRGWGRGSHRGSHRGSNQGDDGESRADDTPESSSD